MGIVFISQTRRDAAGGGASVQGGLPTMPTTMPHLLLSVYPPPFFFYFYFSPLDRKGSSASSEPSYIKAENPGSIVGLSSAGPSATPMKPAAGRSPPPTLAVRAGMHRRSSSGDRRSSSGDRRAWPASKRPLQLFATLAELDSFPASIFSR